MEKWVYVVPGIWTRAAGWQARTNPLSSGGRHKSTLYILLKKLLVESVKKMFRRGNQFYYSIQRQLISIACSPSCQPQTEV